MRVIGQIKPPCTLHQRGLNVVSGEAGWTDHFRRRTGGHRGKGRGCSTAQYRQDAPNRDGLVHGKCHRNYSEQRVGANKEQTTPEMAQLVPVRANEVGHLSRTKEVDSIAFACSISLAFFRRLETLGHCLIFEMPHCRSSDLPPVWHITRRRYTHYRPELLRKNKNGLL